jgi:hypothetical protein
MSETITMEEAAAALDGDQYGEEGSRELFARMKDAGLVAAFGASADLLEMRGAIGGELGAFGGGEAHIGERGLPKGVCLYFEKRLEWAPYVEALWCPDGVEGNPSWLMKLSDDRPTAQFKIMEDDDLFCIGVVFPLRWPT